MGKESFDLETAVELKVGQLRKNSTVHKIMIKSIFLFALIFAPLNINFALAQNTEKRPTRSVKGQVLSSNSLPPLRVKFKKPFKFVGSQSFFLYDRAQVEQFFFVEADKHGQIKRMYMAQFEGSLPNANAAYNYPATKTITLGKEIGQTHLNFIENKGFLSNCNNLTAEKYH